MSALVRSTAASFVASAWLLLGATAPLGPAQDLPTMEAARSKIQSGDFAAAAKLLEEITKAEPTNPAAWRLLGLAYHSQGDLDRALAAHLESTKFPQTAPIGFYNAACIHALRGERDQAFQYLNQAESTGSIDLAQMDADKDLESLRSDTRYLELRPPAKSFEDSFVEPVRVLQQWKGDAALGQFGWIARDIGDVDRDGAHDVVTSAPTLSIAGRTEGRVYVYSSRSGKLLWQATGQPGDQLGLGVEAAGDFDADGTPDVIAGAPGRDVAFVYSGKDGRVLRTLTGQRGEGFGSSVAGVGDLDGDGHTEVIVGAPQAGAADRLTGRAFVFSSKSEAPMLVLQGEHAAHRFGSACAGSLRGTTRMIVVGAPDAGEGARGRVYAYDGAGALRFAIDADASGAELGGMFVSVVGDVDADGVDDVYASDWSDGTLGGATGRVYVHSGKSGERVFALTGTVAGEGFGIGSADCGDTDGDGHADLLIGTWQHGSAARSGGKCSLYSGKTKSILRTITCKVPGDTFGFDATGIGDVDGDGAVDYLVTSAWSRVIGSRAGRMFILAGSRTDRESK
jgi:hypothetical protein